jgi:serine/threonine protein kinase
VKDHSVKSTTFGRLEVDDKNMVSLSLRAWLTIALKTVPRTQLTDAQYKDQLYEATVHLSLPIHSNIVTLHETLQTSKLIFMLLEWCPGDDL